MSRILHQEKEIHDQPVGSEASSHSRGQRILDGAILATNVGSIAAGASDLLTPLKTACDLLGYVLKTARVSNRPA